MTARQYSSWLSQTSARGGHALEVARGPSCRVPAGGRNVHHADWSHPGGPGLSREFFVCPTAPYAVKQTKSIWPRRSPPRDEIARRGRSALRLPWAKSVAMTTVALRTEEFWKRLLRQDEAGRSGHPSRRSASRRLVRGTTQAPTPALRAVLSCPRPLTRDGISPQPASDVF